MNIRLTHLAADALERLEGQMEWARQSHADYNGMKAERDRLQAELADFKRFYGSHDDVVCQSRDMNRTIDRLRAREAEARRILEPLHDCDPEIRVWLAGGAEK